MNILLLTTHLNPGGISRYVINLAKGLGDRKHNVWIASSGGKWRADIETLHISIPVKTKLFCDPRIIISFFKLMPFIYKKRINIIHANTRVTQFLAFLIYKFTRIPYISCYHGFYRPGSFRKMFKFSGVKTIAVSEAVKRHLIEDLRIKSDSIKVIHNGIDLQKLAGSAGKKPADGFRIGILGRISKEKGHFLAVDAFNQLSQKHSGVLLIISGKGKLENRLKKHINKLKLNNKVQFVNFGPQDFFNIIDLLIMPSRKEGFGYSVIEAFMKEVPVIGFNTGGIAEIIKDRKNGLLFYKYNSAALKSSIEELMTDETLRRQIVKNAKQEIHYFSLERMASDTEKLYQETLA